MVGKALLTANIDHFSKEPQFEGYHGDCVPVPCYIPKTPVVAFLYYLFNCLADVVHFITNSFVPKNLFCDVLITKLLNG